jgi:hypothetical protein
LVRCSNFWLRVGTEQKVKQAQKMLLEASMSEGRPAKEEPLCQAAVRVQGRLGRELSSQSRAVAPRHFLGFCSRTLPTGPGGFGSRCWVVSQTPRHVHILSLCDVLAIKHHGRRARRRKWRHRLIQHQIREVGICSINRSPATTCRIGAACSPVPTLIVIFAHCCNALFL